MLPLCFRFLAAAKTRSTRRTSDHRHRPSTLRSVANERGLISVRAHPCDGTPVKLFQLRVGLSARLLLPAVTLWQASDEQRERSPPVEHVLRAFLIFPTSQNLRRSFARVDSIRSSALVANCSVSSGFPASVKGCWCPHRLRRRHTISGAAPIQAVSMKAQSMEASLMEAASSGECRGIWTGAPGDMAMGGTALDSILFERMKSGTGGYSYWTV